MIGTEKNSRSANAPKEILQNFEVKQKNESNQMKELDQDEILDS
jgi:hypothetical protein